MMSQAATNERETSQLQVPHNDVVSQPSVFPVGEREWPLRFHGSEQGFFSLCARNLLSTLLTLGGYSPWATTQQRRYLASHLEVAEDRFVYHGAGGELLRGRLKALLLYSLPGICLSYLLSCLQAWFALPQDLLALASLPPFGFFYLLMVAAGKVGARRYRLSRISLRGIYFSFRGSLREFLELYVAGVLLTLLTLGGYYPWFVVRREHFLVSHSYYGSQAFSFCGQARGLLFSFCCAWLLSLVTLLLGWRLRSAPSTMLAILLVAGGAVYCRESLRERSSALVFAIGALGVGSALWYAGSLAGAGLLTAVVLAYIWCWYVAAQRRYLWAHTAYSTLHFQSSVTGDRLFRLLLGNVGLCLGVSGGTGLLLWLAAKVCGVEQPENLAVVVGLLVWMAFPWTALRNMRFIVRHMTITGGLDDTSITQDYQPSSGLGEGFVGLLNLGSRWV